MESCPYGSEAKPGAPIDGGVVYFTDLAFPIGLPGSPIQEFDGRNLTLDVGALLGGNYNLFPMNAQTDITIDGFCSHPPGLGDVAPGTLPFVAAAALYEMQKRWNQHCRCSLPPPPDACNYYGGYGQCQISYGIHFSYKLYSGENLLGTRRNNGTPYFTGSLGVPYIQMSGGFKKVILPYETQRSPALTAVLGNEWDVYEIRDIQITIVNRLSRNPITGVQSPVTAANDNCCPVPTRPPTPEPDPDPDPNNKINIDLPEDNVTVIVIQGFCDPSACTTKAGPAGETGEKGDKGDRGDVGPAGADGATGATGAQGETGPAGPVGAQGDKGDKGDKGDPGEAGANGAPGAKGDKGDKGDRGDVGPAGADGATGAAGATGAKGDKGDKGDQGEQGIQGEPGEGLEDFDIIPELVLLGENDPTEQGFTRTRIFNIFRLTLKLKMDNELVRRIYQILGGDEWFQNSDTPSLQFPPRVEIENYEDEAKTGASVVVTNIKKLMAALFASANAATKNERIYQILGGDSWYNDNRTTSGFPVRIEEEIESARFSSFHENGFPKQVEASNIIQLMNLQHGVNRHRSGHFRFPARVPRDLTSDATGDSVQYIQLQDEMAWQEWLVKQLDALSGAYPVKIKYKDVDNAEKEIKFENQAEAIAEITGMLLSINTDTDFLQALGMKTIVETTATRMAATKAYDYAKANSEFLGYQDEEKEVEIRIPYDPKGESMNDFMKESTQKTTRFKAREEASTLVEMVRQLLVGVGIIKGAFWRDLGLFNRDLPGERIKAEKAKIKDDKDTEWNNFIKQMEAPPSTHNPTGAIKPDLDKLTNYAPPSTETGSSGGDGSTGGGG